MLHILFQIYPWCAKTWQAKPNILLLQYAKQNKHQSKTLGSVKKLEEKDEVTEEIALASLRRALDQFSSLQSDDGCWPGDFSGVMFIMPGLVRTNSNFHQSPPSYVPAHIDIQLILFFAADICTLCHQITRRRGDAGAPARDLPLHL